MAVIEIVAPDVRVNHSPPVSEKPEFDKSYASFSFLLTSLAFPQYGNVNSFKDVHPLNTEYPMVETLLGTTIDTNSLQFSNAQFPILIIVSGSKIFEIDLQLLNA